MKLNFPNLRIAAALGLAAGMMIGVPGPSQSRQVGLRPRATSSDQTGSLSLSIRNDSTCMGEWHDPDARSGSSR